MPEIKSYLERSVSPAPFFDPPLTENDLRARADEPSLGGAFFRQTPLFGLYSGLAQSNFKGDKKFDWEKTVATDPVFFQFPELFYGVRSQEQFDFLKSKISGEMADRKALHDAGLIGTALGFASGFVSPTILLPFGAALKGAGVLRTATVAAGAAGIDEVFLQFGQKTRTPAESAISIAGAAVLGGVLGGAIKYLSPRQQEELLQDILELDTGRKKPVEILLPSGNRIKGLSAQKVETGFVGEDPGSIAPVFKVQFGKYVIDLDKPFWKIFPSTRVLAQDVSPTARWIQAQLTTGGLKTEAHLEGRVTAPLGEAENLVKRYWGNVAQAMNETKALYKEQVRDLGEDAMPRKVFAIAIGESLRRGGKHFNPYVARAAQVYREKIFKPLLQEAQELGIEGFDKITEADAIRYLPRQIRDGMAITEQDKFKETLRLLVMDELKSAFSTATNNFYQRAHKEINLLRLLKDPKGLDKTISNLQAEMKDVAEKLQAHQSVIENRRQLIKELREQVKEAALAKNFARANELTAKARKLADENRKTGEIRRLKTARKKIQDELENLLLLGGLGEDLSRELGQKLAQTRVKILRLQSDLGLRLKAFAEAIEGVPPEQVREQFEKLTTRYENNIKRLEKAAKEFDDEGLRKTLTNLKRVRSELEKVREKMLENDLPEAKQNLLDLAEKITKDHNVEISKLLEKARGLKEKINLATAEGRDNFVRSVEQKLREKYTQFEDVLQRNRIFARDSALPLQTITQNLLLRPSDYDLDAAAKEIADDIFNKYMGFGGHLPALSMLSKRTPMHERMFKVDETKVVANGKKLEDFLESDIEKLSRRYIRTMGPDLVLYKLFGRFNPLGPDSSLTRKITEEFRQRAQQLEKEIGELSPGTLIPKRNALIKNELLLRRTLHDLEGQIERLRHVWGAPKDPTNGFFRAGKFLLNMNVLTMMWMVTVSSLPDVGRLTMKQVLQGSLRVPFKQFLTNTTEAFQALREGQLSGTANDVMLHGRANAVFDIFDDIEMSTKLERGVDAAAQNIGKLAGFDYWNTAMKADATFSALAMIRQGSSDLVRGVANKSTRVWLAQHGIDKDLAARVVEYSKKYQPEQLKHIISPEHWLENFEAKVKEARLKHLADPQNFTEDMLGEIEFQFSRMKSDIDVLRAATAKFADDTIVTPGIDRPLIADANIWGRIFFQFKSFMLDSTKRVLFAGAQDMRLGAATPVLLGALSALTWGIVSYAARAAATGGPTWEKFKQRVQKEEWDEIILEGFSRSGLFGFFEEARAMAERVPALRPIASFGTDTTTDRRFLFGPLDSALGPSYSTLKRVGRMTTQVDQDPGDALATGVRLIPGNNMIGLSWLFRRLEEVLRDIQ